MPPSAVKKRYNFRNMKKKAAEPDSSSSSSSSESEEESESEYKPSSPSNGTNETNATNSSEEEETVYTECSSTSESDQEADRKSKKDKKESTQKFDKHKFRKMLSKMFPSKYSRQKEQEAAGDESDESEDSESSDSELEASSSRRKKQSKTGSKKHKGKNGKDAEKSKKGKDKGKGKDKSKDKGRKNKRRDSSEDEDDDEYDDDEEDDSDSSDEEMNLNETGKISLIVSVGGQDDEEYDEYDDEVESLVEDSTEDFDSDAEKMFMGESYEQLIAEHERASSPKMKKDGKRGSKSKKSAKDDAVSDKKPEEKKEEDRDPIPVNIESEYREMLDVKKMLIEQLKRRPKNTILEKSLKECNRGIKKLARKARHANTNAYYKLINGERRQTNEIDYFKHKLSNKEQQGIMTDLKEINKTIYADKPHRLALLQSKIPAKFKMVAMQRLNMLKSMEPGDHEYYKIKNWVDAFMRIPFGIYRSIDVKMSDGIEVSNRFMEDAKKTLDDCVYGLNDAKLQIMQMLGQWVVNPDSVGTAIAIHGPPGTGKTSIVKDGISRILGREFAFIALGGCGDGSFLEGHSYTYEGSSWGKIAQILMECKSMNPIIYFDELDKVSDSARGQEIIGILTHLTDTTQNGEFHDKYFSEVSLDLSKCLFIFSYNEEHLVNPILKDRMYRIQTKGYDTKEKITIARDYLLPKIREQVSFSKEDIIIPDDTLQYLISTPHLTKGESGVRNLKRCLEIIYTKLNLYRLVKPGNAMFEKDLGVKVEFPITITRKEVDVFIKNNETLNPSILAMYC